MVTKSFEVSLNNRDCIFSSANDMQSLEEALKWAIGHGGNFNILINEINDGEIVEMLHYCWNGRNLMQRDMFGWHYIKTPK